MTVPNRRWLAWSPLVLSLAFLIIAGAIELASGTGEATAVIFLGALALVFGVVGALIAARHSGNPIGWLFLAASVAASSTYLAEACANSYIATRKGPPLLAELAATYDLVSWIPFAVAPTTFLLLLVPDGRLLTPRWRWIGWAAALGMAGSFISGGIVAGPISAYPQLENPIGVASDSELLPFQVVPLLLVAGGIVGSATSLIIRFRRASGEERLQLKWLALAGAMAGITILLATTAGYAVLGDDLSNILIMVSLMGLPIATGIAIMRYRLYDIDVVINRALVYGTLTAVLAGVYLSSVLLLQLILETFTGGSGLAVAASTLGTAALFGPLRSRTQAVVDRRFFRSKYDATRTLERFSVKVRNEVDLDMLTTELREAIAEAVQPEHISLWTPKP
jgi:hypothetical protein